MQGPPINKFTVQILTLSFQITGQLESIGPFLEFLVDPVRDALSITDAQVLPLMPGGPLKGMTRPQISLRKPEVVFIYPLEQVAKDQVRLLARKEPYIVYTPLAILRASFHLSAEARAQDLFSTMSADFVPITEVSLFSLLDLPAPFPQKPDLLIVGRQYVQLYHAS